LVSSHTNTGGFWTSSDLRRLYALGGFATARPDQPPKLADRIVTLCGFHGGGHAGVGLGTDTGGFNSLPGPRPDASKHPLKYPFHFAGVRFKPERTGKRTFNINTGGVAQYGQFADLLAEVRQQKRGARATRSLFHSAQAYLHTWRRAYRHG
jgi:hypothetical protein